MDTWVIPKDVADAPRTRWYRERAEECARRAMDLMQWSHLYTPSGKAAAAERAAAYAREAGHWGGLVIGLEQHAGETIALLSMEVRIADQSPAAGRVPVGDSGPTSDAPENKGLDPLSHAEGRE